MKEILSSVISVTRDERVNSAPSSKGNQIKWRTYKGIWLKADDFGYEGLSEVVAAQLLKGSNIHSHVPYSPCMITEDGIKYRGCVSEDFLLHGESLVTIYRLLASNEHDVDVMFQGKSAQDRLHDLISVVTALTELDDFGVWFGKLLEFDAFILNEDRHLHNIAVILKDNGQFRLMPVFDNGAAFLSDTRRDYPFSAPTTRLVDKVRSKPIVTHFRDQIKAVADVVGLSLKLQPCFKLELGGFCCYNDKEVGRVRQVIDIQANRYPYLFG